MLQPDTTNAKGKASSKKNFWCSNISHDFTMKGGSDVLVKTDKSYPLPVQKVTTIQVAQ